MIKQRRKQLIPFYILSDIIIVVLSVHLSFWLRFNSSLFDISKGIPAYSNYLFIIPLFIIIQTIHFSTQGYYRIKLSRNRLDDLFLVFINSIFTSFIVLLLVSYLKSYNFVDFEVSHLFLVIYVFFSTFGIFAIRLFVFKIYKIFYSNKNGVSKVIIVGYDTMGILVEKKLKKYSHFGIEIIGFLDEKKEDVLGKYDDLEKIVKKYGITDMFIALSLKEYDEIMKLIDVGNSLYLDIKLVPDILQIASIKAGVEHLEGIPTINLGDIPLQGWKLIFKRSFDMVLSIMGLIIILFPLFIIALIIKFTSKGPIFYLQERVGVDGKLFKMIKFRTMGVDAEKQTGAIWSPPDDNRVTPIGRFLRKFSIDELPQIINVIKGDMSLVGPRPERPELVDKFKNSIPKYMLRHRVKTGMTGWAQVHGLRGNTPLDKRVEFDIYYIQNWTFRLDLEILWRTFLKLQFVDRNM